MAIQIDVTMNPLRKMHFQETKQQLESSSSKEDMPYAAQWHNGITAN